MKKSLLNLLISLTLIIPLGTTSVRGQEISNALQFPECTTEYAASTFLLNSSSNAVLKRIKNFHNRFRDAHFCLRDGKVMIWVYQTYRYANRERDGIARHLFGQRIFFGDKGLPQEWMYRNISIGSGLPRNRIIVIVNQNPLEFPYQYRQP